MDQYWIILEYTEGFTRLWPSVGTVLAMGASMYFSLGPPRGSRSGRPTPSGRGSGPSGRRSSGCFC
jgi:hypothetical protein